MNGMRPKCFQRGAATLGIRRANGKAGGFFAIASCHPPPDLSFLEEGAVSAPLFLSFFFIFVLRTPERPAGSLSGARRSCQDGCRVA